MEEDPSPFWLLKDVQSTPARTPRPRHRVPIWHWLGTSQLAGESTPPSPPALGGTQPLVPRSPLQAESLSPPNGCSERPPIPLTRSHPTSRTSFPRPGHPSREQCHEPRDVSRPECLPGALSCHGLCVPFVRAATLALFLLASPVSPPQLGNSPARHAALSTFPLPPVPGN